MGEEGMFPEWLPAGWTVDVKQKKHGGNYKCYSDPTHDLKFYSMPQVLHHLKISMRRSTSKRRKKMNAGKTPPNKCVIKHEIAEGLPPGWIKETRIRKNEGNKERTDRYYIAPENGRVFRSMKEVSRYLDTGKRSRRRSGLRGEGRENVERSSDNSSSQAEDEKNRRPKRNAAKEVVEDQDLKSVENGGVVEVTESDMINEADRDQDMASGEEAKGTVSKANKELDKDQDTKLARKGDKIPHVEGAEDGREESPNNKANTEVVEGQDSKSGSKDTGKRKKTLQATKKVQKRKKENDIPGSMTGSTSPNMDIVEKAPPVNVTEKLPPGNGAEKHGSRTVHKCNKLCDADKAAVPRRTSKRLAGGGVDQLLELDRNSRARPVGVRSSEKNADVRDTRKDLDCSDQDIRSVQQPCKKDDDTGKNLRSLEASGQHFRRVENDAETSKNPEDSDCSAKNVERAQQPSKKDSDTRRNLKSLEASGQHVRRVENDAETRKNTKDSDCLAKNVERVQQPSKKDADTRKSPKNLESADQNIRRVQQPPKKDTVTRKNPKDLDCSDHKVRRVHQPSKKDAKSRKNPKDSDHSEKNIRVGQQAGSSCHEKQPWPALVPSGYPPLPRSHDNMVTPPLDASCRDFLNDPCIEFAIKTLIGAIPVGEEKATAGDDDKARNPGCFVSSTGPTLSLAACQDLWTDPCFEFAVKTLTGEIPIEEDSAAKTPHQQPPCIPEAQRHNGLSPPAAVRSESFFPANPSADNPFYRRQDLVTPVASRVQSGSSISFGC